MHYQSSVVCLYGIVQFVKDKKKTIVCTKTVMYICDTDGLTHTPIVQLKVYIDIFINLAVKLDA